MSSTKREYNRENRRRYTLQSPSIDSGRNNSHEELQRGRSISSVNKDYFVSNVNKSSKNESINDPYVRELLERDIDFTKLYQEEEVQLLKIPNIKQSKFIPKDSSYQNNSKSPIIINEYPSQCKILLFYFIFF